MVKKEQIKNLLLDWRGRIAPAADDLMEQMFESADQVLLEYADKAENNAIQAKFIEGQRELWAKKTQVASLFRDNLGRELFQFMRPVQRADAPGSETLSLVSKETFELSLALQTISDQAVQNNQELYYALSQRLGVVTGSPAVDYEQLPAGPHQLAGVFESAAQMLTVERQVLLALYTLFEREVIRESPPWHDDLNEVMRKSGILPNLKYRIKRDPDKLRPEKNKPKVDTSPRGQAPGYGGTYQNESVLPGYQGSVGTGGSPPPVHGHSSYDGNAGPGSAAHDSGGFSGGSGSESSVPLYDNYGNRIGPEPTVADTGDYSPSAGSWNDTPGQDGGADSTGRDHGTQDTGGGGKELGDQLLGRIRELLTARRAHQSSADGSAARPDPVAPAPASIVAAVIDSPQVRQSVVIPETGTLDAGVRQVTVSRELLEKLRVALSAQRAQIKETVGEDKLSHFDEDTIDIVGMLFEVMLNDDRLNNTVKALLSHLHTPYLKLAVRDRAFLKRPNHPARRLFDNMVEAGSRWVDERDLTQGIYPKLQRVVDLIMQAGDHPLQLLLELDEGLSAEIMVRSERQKVREVRTVETEKGKARLEEAREAAAQATHQFLAATGTPVHFQEFIAGPWTDYLTLLYLRSNGDTDSGIWHSALGLGKRLRAYVDGLAKGSRPSEDELKALRNELVQRLGDAIPHYEAKVQQLFELFSGDHEVTIVAPSPEIPPPAPAVKVKLSSSGKDLLQRLPKLPPGSWVVFHSRDEADQVVKLSWFNRKTERFLFVDQAGAKALVVPLQKLADQIDRERAHVMLATGTSYVESSLERALNTLEKRD